MKKKVFGLILWSLGCVGLLVYYSFNGLKPSLFWFVVAAALLLYNWLYSRQKGHVVHLALLAGFAASGGILAVSLVVNINEAILTVVAAVIVLPALPSFIKVVRGFNYDYLAGVSRDHFEDRS